MVTPVILYFTMKAIAARQIMSVRQPVNAESAAKASD